jgi:hypothetical protein
VLSLIKQVRFISSFAKSNKERKKKEKEKTKVIMMRAQPLGRRFIFGIQRTSQRSHEAIHQMLHRQRHTIKKIAVQSLSVAVPMLYNVSSQLESSCIVQISEDDDDGT